MTYVDGESIGGNSPPTDQQTPTEVEDITLLETATAPPLNLR